MIVQGAFNLLLKPGLRKDFAAMFEDLSRCDSIFKFMRCNNTVGHSGSHSGFARGSKLIVKWTTEEGRGWRRAELLRQQLLHAPKKRTGAIHAWRAWRLVKHDMLASMVATASHDYPNDPFTWPGPVATTRLDTNGKPMRVSSEWPAVMGVPADYGVHAFKKPSTLIEQYHGLADVYGRVDLLGHVVAHKLGYRAQICVVRELWYVRKSLAGREPLSPLNSQPGWSVVDALAQRYQCATHEIDTFKTREWARFMDDEPEEE